MQPVILGRGPWREATLDDMLGEVLLFKILLPVEWTTFESSGRFDGSPFDIASGFVHCSSRAQVGSAAQRFFSNESALIVVTLDAQRLGDMVRWEPTSNGELFPHVYGPLPLSAVVRVYHVAGAAKLDEALAGS